MNKKNTILHSIFIAIPFLFILLLFEQAYADEFTYVKFQKTYKTKRTYCVHVIKMGSRLKGVKKITMSSSNKEAVFVNSSVATSEKMVFFSPMERGKATVTAKLSTKSKTTTYKFQVIVIAPPRYKITFNPNGGSVKPKYLKIRKGSRYRDHNEEPYGELPKPKRSGYKFDGWYTKKSGGKKITANNKLVKNANHTLYAHWLKIYKVKYKNVSRKDKEFTVKTATFNLPTVKKTGYDFGGWYTDSNYKTKITKIKKGTKKNVTVYAKWIKRIFISSASDVSEKQVNMVFNALKSGTISAEKADGLWRYKFTYGVKAILLPVSFFYDKNNSTAPYWFTGSINDNFNTGYQETDGSNGVSHNFLIKNLGFSYFPELSNNITTECFYQNIYKLSGQLTKDKNHFSLLCEYIDQVSFCCYDADEFGKTPTTAKEYVSLLKRTNFTYKDKIVPHFTVTMNNPGSYNGELYFGSYSVSGVGHENNENVSDLIDVGVSAVKIVSSLPSMSFKTFYDIYNVMNTLIMTGSNSYSCSGIDNLLSQKGNYCYAYKFTSPLSLVNKGDKIQLNVTASIESLTIPFSGFKGTETDIEFAFDFV